jgi:GTPase SAR1 family protein
VTRKETFTRLKKMVTELREKAEPDCVIYLVGNKYDLVAVNPDARQVSYEEAKLWASEEKMNFMEASAATGHKVNDAFENLAERIIIYNYKRISCL